MYSVLGHGQMVREEIRAGSYAAALREVITPGCTVLDIGTGAGVFAALACAMGARRVFAVEPNEIIQVAREIAVANGYADRITFFQDLSTQIDLPVRADVVFSDLRDVLPYFGAHIASIVDARARHLAPGGVLIPRRDTMSVALVESPELYANHRMPETIGGYALDTRAYQRRATQIWRKAYVPREALLSAPVCCATLDYRTITEPNLLTTVTLPVERAGTMHGIAVWFDSELTANVGFSNAPGQPKVLYGNAFFPLSAAVDVAEGDTVTLELRATLVGGEYIWQWDTRVLPAAHGSTAARHFRQSSFGGAALSLERLRTLRSRTDAPDHGVLTPAQNVSVG
jgi:protein arginine N-methyltransferase 1